MKKIVSIIFIASLLGACSSKVVKDEQKSSPAPTQPKAPEPASAMVEPVSVNKVEVNPLTDPNNILSKRSVYFDFDKFEVKSEYHPLLDAHAKYLSEHSQASITIQGNADERGSREYNLALGQKRAASVKKVLNVLGVPDRQIETISYGKEKPKALGHDEAAWAENRRADIIYSGEK